MLTFYWWISLCNPIILWCVFKVYVSIGDIFTHIPHPSHTYRNIKYMGYNTNNVSHCSHTLPKLQFNVRFYCYVWHVISPGHAMGIGKSFIMNSEKNVCFSDTFQYPSHYLRVKSPALIHQSSGYRAIFSIPNLIMSITHKITYPGIYE